MKVKNFTLAAYPDSKVYHRVRSNYFLHTVKYSLCGILAADSRYLATGQSAKRKRRKCRLCFRPTKRKE